MPQDLGSLEKVLRLGEGRRLKRLQAQADYVASLEPDFEQLSDEELAAKTVEFKERYENGETLEELLFEAYAAVREAAKRSLGQRPFDVQVMGGIVLHEGDIAEMKTGEGKTLVATQPLYLNAVAVGETALPARDILDRLLAIEHACGRERPYPGAPRTLDLDLILLGSAIEISPGLEVPHPRFRDRFFVLGPLAEIAPDLVDPVTGLKVSELLRNLLRDETR